MDSNQMMLNNNKILQDDILESLIKRIALEDKHALAELYHGTKTAVYGFVFSLLKNKHDAEDIFQEVYLKIYESAESYKAKGKPMAWIFTIAKNLCYMKFRKEKEFVDIEEVPEMWMTSENVEERIVLDAAFEMVSDEERNIIFLHVLSGLRHREIAEILEIPLATVLSKYHRTIAKLKKVLEGMKDE